MRTFRQPNKQPFHVFIVSGLVSPPSLSPSLFMSSTKVDIVLVGRYNDMMLASKAQAAYGETNLRILHAHVPISGICVPISPPSITNCLVRHWKKFAESSQRSSSANTMTCTILQPPQIFNDYRLEHRKTFCHHLLVLVQPHHSTTYNGSISSELMV